MVMLRRILTLTWLALISASGCSPQAARQQYDRVWPAEPAKARFKLVQIVQGATDFGEVSILQAISDFATGARARTLLRPQGVAVHEDKYLCVADVELQGVHVFDFHSAKSTFIRQADAKPLVSPVDVANCDGQLAVSDSVRNEVFLFTMAGGFVRSINKPGGFKRPTGLAYWAQEKQLYVVDTLDNEVCVFDLSGQLLRRFGGRGTNPGQFNYPTHIFVDQDGKTYVTDSLNFRVQVFDRDGRFLFKIGKHGDASGHLGVPKGVAVDRFGHIYVADSYFSNVQVFDRDGQFLLSFGEHGEGPGSFLLPCGLTIGPDGRIFVCDSHNRRLQVFQYVGDEDAQTSDH